MNHITYVYIDESGDLGKFGSKYFIIASIITDEPLKLGRIIKKLRERKLKKKIRELPEIKANNSNRRIREFILKKISQANCKIFAVVVDKEKIFDYLFNKQDKLYNYFCGVLLKTINLNSEKIIITIDQKHTNTLIRSDFDNYIKSRLFGIRNNIKLEIYHKHSYYNAELQVVDFVVWSISRKFNAGDDYYYKIIENKIMNKDEMLIWKN